MCPKEGTGFTTLIAQVKFDIFYLVGIDNGAFFCPTFMIDSCGNAVRGGGSSKNVHDETLIVTVYGEIHFPAVFGTPVPIEYILIVPAIEIPVNFTPQCVDAPCKGLFCGGAVDVILVYGKQTLHQESGFHEVTAVVFLSERFYPSGISEPPVRVGTVETVGCFKKRDDALHACQPFFTGDVTAVDACQHSHDSEATATGGHYILVIFGIDTIYMDTFACQSAIRFGSFPKVIEGTALQGVHQCFVAYPVRFCCRAFTLCKAQQQQEQ